MPPDVLVALTTFPAADAARECVRALVETGLVACGNVLPGTTSIYRWKGTVETADETLVVFKVAADRWEQFAASLLERHPYEVPELVAFPVTRGHGPYLDWVVGGAR